jgi:membrane protein DedA with SNARE-associated domain/rhodanese-related sulfurtransferase
MNHADLTQALAQNGAWLVFLNVLLQQLGLPVPAVPTLIAAGSLLAGFADFSGLLAAAVLASALADAIWYLAGRGFGYRVLSALCRLSLNPASCVNQTEARFVRWGLWSLVVAKFIPGFSTVAPPIAGALRMPLPGFLGAAVLGAALWAGLALLGGLLLHDQIGTVLALAVRHGLEALLAFAVLVLVWLSWKFWQKRIFELRAAIPHLDIDALLAAMRSAEPPLLLDLRGESLRSETGAIPGARIATYDSLATAVADWPRDALVVTLCACPADAGAVLAAREITSLGYRQVRPLRGGFEAWQAHAGGERL